MPWDQINEMSQNSPNSLSPMQGLILWMFTIIAFLKLAQKMDDLLQKLGLNVTQTGGRALGDLMVAGMAIDVKFSAGDFALSEKHSAILKKRQEVYQQFLKSKMRTNAV